METAEKDFFGENFAIPNKSDQFLKIKEGETTIRFMENPIEGFVVYTADKKNVRKKAFRDEARKITAESFFTKEELSLIDRKKDSKGKVEEAKFFWLTIVYHYESDSFKILEITSQSLIKSMLTYFVKKSWKNPKLYDLVITRTGMTMLDTDYQVTNEMPSELPEKVLEAFAKVEYDLEAIFTGGYPISN